MERSEMVLHGTAIRTWLGRVEALAAFYPMPPSPFPMAG